MQIDDETTEPKWATEIIQYLKNGLLSEDKAQSQKVKLQSAWYTMIGEAQYRRRYTLPLLKCLPRSKADYVLKEIHEGVHGSDVSTKSNVIRILLANNE
jgi:hypothetical protein